MKQLLASSRSKYLFTLMLSAIFIGVISRKATTYPIECLPINNQEMTYSSKFNRYNFS